MFQWNDYLQLAKESEQQSSNSQIQEAYLRTAISRAYYAAYHKARKYAINNGFPDPGKRGFHQGLCTFLKGEGNSKITDSTIMLLGNRLDFCRKARGKCDYEDTLDFDLIFRYSKVIQESEFIISNLP